ncbi:MAG: hypothetical protein E7111_01750 [Bacteroidales bacterium]|nr:hypothetical protein [Bacteroidales bacterium]
MSSYIIDIRSFDFAQDDMVARRFAPTLSRRREKKPAKRMFREADPVILNGVKDLASRPR